MPKPLVRVGDKTLGHFIGPNYYPPTPAITGSPNVFADGKPVVRVGDSFAPHCSGTNCHPVSVITGLSDVIVNGQPAAYVSETLSCGDHTIQGSPDVSEG